MGSRRPRARRRQTRDEVDTEAVLRVLTPLWSATPETASRRRGRIEALLASAQVDGWIPEDRPNAARWKDSLDRKLPKRKRLTRGHHKALDCRDIAEFVKRLRASDNMAALALEFLIVTRDQKRGNDQRAVAHTRPRRRRVVNSKGADEEDRRSLQRPVV
jgi:hypothetical protein